MAGSAKTDFFELPDLARDGRFLVCQRPLHKRHGGLWEFPGGTCEDGESDADAIRREAERVIPDIEAGRFPFDDSLVDWRPEPGWPIPRLSSSEQ